ncbi:DUF2357 domain-containing protein [Ktedonobacter robiniae]|uniref:DUF2357 domain-containing protein n=1 Tax=Ktedonobacter robiniae TaxID=2778365 RepID=A0ABQ3UUT2_9CHLR|nr:DUF2357 domain-containing protein [Ktedonobacter robiniae]GHO56095.1 hypothetical protein KSB_45700 [Ktedonobacter robiniae]
MATPASGANANPDTWLTLNGKPLSFQEGAENLEAGAMEYRRNELIITAYAPRPIEIFIDQVQLHTHDYGYWQWRPRSYAGLYEVRVTAPGYPDAMTNVRVIPQYFTQTLYQRMQDDLSAIAADLLFSLVSSVSERVKSVRRLQETSALQDYRHVRAIVHKLGDVLSEIRRDPYYVLSKTTEQRDWHDVWQFNADCQSIGGDAIHVPRRSTGNARSLTLPTRWQVAHSTVSYDVYENRLLKQFLQKQLVAKLNSIQERAESEIKQRSVTLAYMQRNHFQNAEDEQREITALKGAIEQCQSMKVRCRQWGSERFLHSVQSNVLGGKATQVLLKHPIYSRFYKLYLEFQQQLQISLNAQDYLTELSVRKIPELYEMWSVFALTRMAIDELLRNGYEQVSQGLFYEVEKNNFRFEVRKNAASIVLAKEEKRIKIIYEPVYPNRNVTRAEALVTTNGRNLPQTPDMSIELYEHNKPQAVCIFDAKYKRVRETDGYYYPLTEDMDKMTNYVTRIKYQRYDSAARDFRTRDIVSSAYVLYPGNRIYEEGDGEVGGIPLRPNMPSHLQEAARKKLHDILYEANMI